MRYDMAKSWPHPVLRPSASNDGDYTDVEFQVEATLDRVEDATNVRLHAQFELTADNLQQAIADGNAANVLLIRCAEAFFRTSIETRESEVERFFDQGLLSGPVELLGFVIATRKFSLRNSGQWHADYSADAFDIEPGYVLAQDNPLRAVVDTAENQAIGSIFEHIAVAGMKPNTWRCDLDGERVRLQLSADDERSLLAIREGINAPAGTYATVVNGVYLPALIYVLISADQDGDAYELRRWYRALDARLDDHKLPKLGTEGADRAKDAQILLKEPFGKLIASYSNEGMVRE